MKYGILGTGMVGEALAKHLASKGHEVMIGSRTGKMIDVANAKFGTFDETAKFGEVLFNCTMGLISVDALKVIGRDRLKNKILIDVANPLDFSKGMPPTLSVSNTDSLGEQLQREFPEAKVVKAFNTVNCAVMVNPNSVPGDHHLFICGNDDNAKKSVLNILVEDFGWKAKNIFDLGDITNSRATESLLPLWIRLWGKLGTASFNFKIVSS